MPTLSRDASRVPSKKSEEKDVQLYIAVAGGVHQAEHESDAAKKTVLMPQEKNGVSVTRMCVTGQAACAWPKSVLGSKAFWVFTHISRWHPDCSECSLCYCRKSGPITLMLHDKLLTDLLAFEIKGISEINGLAIYCLLKLLRSSN